MTDAQSVLFSSGGGSSVKRTPWLLQRIEAILGAVEDGDVKLMKIKGTANPVNSLTKYTAFPEWLRDIKFLVNMQPDSLGPALENVSAGELRCLFGLEGVDMAEVIANLGAELGGASI